MKTNSLFFIIVLFCSILLGGCKRTCEGLGSVTRELVAANNTSHTITIEITDSSTSFDERFFEISPNEKETILIVRGEGPTPIPIDLSFNAPRQAIVTFDNEFQFFYHYQNLEIQHNFCRSGHYERKVVNKRGALIATFTFTDADYDYAVEHGTRLE